MVRRLIWIAIVAATLWCAWWAVAAFGLHSGLTAWFDARRGDGWQAEVQGPDMRGFPLTLRADLTGIALADPDTGLAIEVPTLNIAAPTIWPGDVTVTWPPAPILIATPQGKAEATAQHSVMGLALHPGPALALEHLAWDAGPWRITTPEGSLATATALRLAMVQSGDRDSATYTIEATAPDFAPGTTPRAAWRVPDDWPLTFDALSINATLDFDRRWDLRALDERRPQPRRIALHLAEAHWGDLRLRVAADLTVDAEGIPTGTVNLQAENWRVMLDLAQTAGVLSAGMKTQAEQGLDRLARMGGNPKALDLQLNLRGGFMAVGIIPIGPAPRLILR